MENKKSKISETINKLPFNNIAKKIPVLGKFSSYANYAVCVLVLLFVVMLVLPSSPSLAGTWVLVFDGAHGGSGKVIVDKNTETFAEQIIIFKKNGSYYSRNPKTRTTKNDTLLLKDGTFGFYAVDYSENRGKWSLKNGILEVNYDDGGGYKYDEGKFEFDKEKLKLGSAIFYRK